MKIQHLSIASCVAIVLCGCIASTQASQPATVFQEAQRAVGGSKRIEAVQSFRASGRLVQLGADLGCDLHGLLPDHFKRETFGQRSTIFGFNRTGLLNPWRGTGTSTKEEIDDRNHRELQKQRSDFARLVLALFARPLATRSMTVGTAATSRLPDDGQVRTTSVSGSDGFASRLIVDIRTGLLVAVSWDAPDIVWPGQSALVPGDPSQMRSAISNLPIVEHQLVVSDHRSVSGILVPFTIDHQAGGRSFSKLILSEMMINPPMTSDVFAPFPRIPSVPKGLFNPAMPGIQR